MSASHPINFFFLHFLESCVSSLNSQKFYHSHARANSTHTLGIERRSYRCLVSGVTNMVSRQYRTSRKHKTQLKLIDCLCATRWTPPDYWQTDNSNGLVMVIRNYHWLNSARRVLIYTCSEPLVQMVEHTIFTVWPWPLTYDLDLQSQTSQGQGRLSHQKTRSKVKQESTHRQTDGHTHTCTLSNILSPLPRGR